MLSLRILFLSSVISFVSLSSISQAQETNSNPYSRNDPPPEWAKPLPYKTLTCRETAAYGIKAQNGGYEQTPYKPQKYTISRLTPEQMTENSNFCRKENYQGPRLDGDIFLYDACYRFHGALNALKASQGWCTEMYRKNRPTNVTCDFNQPVLSFMPSGDFMAYGRRLNYFNPEDPFIPVAFTSIGTCTSWSEQTPKPLVSFK